MSIIRNTIFKILYRTGLAHILFFRNKSIGRIPILLFHRISPESDPCWPPLHPEVFERTIRFLSKYYKFCSLDDLLGPRIDKNACCVVFDDGYQDFKEYAFPTLLKYNVPTTLFVPTHNIENGLPIWTNQVDNFVRNLKKELQNKFIQIHNVRVPLKLHSDKELFATATLIKNILMKVHPESRDKTINNLQAKYHQKQADIKMLSWQDLRDMQSKSLNLLSVQSHTHTHPFLPLMGQELVDEELQHSRNYLNSKKLNNIDKIAYPIGGYSQETIDLAKKYYDSGYKVGDEPVELNKLRSQENYRYQIPRFNISDTSEHEIFFRINLFHGYLLKQFR